MIASTSKTRWKLNLKVQSKFGQMKATRRSQLSALIIASQRDLPITFILGSVCSRKRKVHGAKVPSSKSSREQIGQGPIGTLAPGSELTWELKGCDFLNHMNVQCMVWFNKVIVQSYVLRGEKWHLENCRTFLRLLNMTSFADAHIAKLIFLKRQYHSYGNEILWECSYE